MSVDSPRVESFVLRFVQDAPESVATSSRAPSWRGVVLHVQSNTETNFTEIADALAFIARYVPVGDFVFQTEDGGRRTDGEGLGHRSSVIGQSGD